MKLYYLKTKKGSLVLTQGRIVTYKNQQYLISRPKRDKLGELYVNLFDTKTRELKLERISMKELKA